MDYAKALIGHRLLDREGNGVGRIGQVFYSGSRPMWATVRTGPLGTDEKLVPLRGALLADGEVRASCGHDVIRGAPTLAAGAPLSAGREALLRRHYGLVGEV